MRGCFYNMAFEPIRKKFELKKTVFTFKTKYDGENVISLNCNVCTRR